jgi:hypothetical protein
MGKPEETEADWEIIDREEPDPENGNYGGFTAIMTFGPKK